MVFKVVSRKAKTSARGCVSTQTVRRDAGRLVELGSCWTSQSSRSAPDGMVWEERKSVACVFLPPNFGTAGERRLD